MELIRQKRTVGVANTKMKRERCGWFKKTTNGRCLGEDKAEKQTVGGSGWPWGLYSEP